MAPGNLQEALAADSLEVLGCVIVFLLERLEPVSLCDECVCYLFSASVAQANARRCVRPLLDIKAKAYMCVHV